MKSLVFGILLLSTTVAFSQQEGYLELFRRDLKTDKVALLTAAMSLSDTASNIFWPIYREYDVELTKLGDNTINNIKDYAANYQSMSDKKADELILRTPACSIHCPVCFIATRNPSTII